MGLCDCGNFKKEEYKYCYSCNEKIKKKICLSCNKKIRAIKNDFYNRALHKKCWKLKNGI